MEDLNILTQHQLELLESILTTAKSEILAAVKRARQCNGDIALVGAASYLELEQCLETAVHLRLPVTDGERPRQLAYTVTHDGSQDVHGPFDDLQQLREDMRDRGLSDEMVDVGHWPERELAVVS